MFERYSFVAITAENLERSKDFWIGRLGFSIVEEEAGHFFIADVGGLRLCVDKADGDIHKLGGTDPVIGLKVKSLEKTLSALKERGVSPVKVAASSKRWASIRGPEGRTVVVTESD